MHYAAQILLTDGREVMHPYSYTKIKGELRNSKGLVKIGSGERALYLNSLHVAVVHQLPESSQAQQYSGGVVTRIRFCSGLVSTIHRPVDELYQLLRQYSSRAFVEIDNGNGLGLHSLINVGSISRMVQIKRGGSSISYPV